MQGSTILNRRGDDNFVMFWVLRGSVEGVGTSRKKNQMWTSKVFASFSKGSTIGEKSVYFKEPYLYNLVAKTHCDVLQLKAGALSMLGVMDRDLGRAIANGAFAVRGADASVRLLLQSPRNIPPILSLIKEGVLSDSFVRDMQKRFRFRIVAKGEFIATKGNIIREVIVLVSGTAHVTVSARDNLVQPLNVAVGGHALAGAVWRHSIIAQTSCQLWALSLTDFVLLTKESGTFSALRERSAALLAQPTTEDSLEAITHRRIAELRRENKNGQESEGDIDGDSPSSSTRRKSRSLLPTNRKTTKTFEIISSPLRPPIPAMDPSALRKLTQRAGAIVERDISRREAERMGTPNKGIDKRSTERSRSLISYLLSTTHLLPTVTDERSPSYSKSSEQPSGGPQFSPTASCRPSSNHQRDTASYTAASELSPSRGGGLPPLRPITLGEVPPRPTSIRAPSRSKTYSTDISRPSTSLEIGSIGQGGSYSRTSRHSSRSPTHNRDIPRSASTTMLWANKTSPLEAIGSLRNRHTSRQMIGMLNPYSN